MKTGSPWIHSQVSSLQTPEQLHPQFDLEDQEKSGRESRSRRKVGVLGADLVLDSLISLSCSASLGSRSSTPAYRTIQNLFSDKIRALKPGHTTNLFEEGLPLSGCHLVHTSCTELSFTPGELLLLLLLVLLGISCFKSCWQTHASSPARNFLLLVLLGISCF